MTLTIATRSARQHNAQRVVHPNLTVPAQVWDLPAGVQQDELLAAPVRTLERKTPRRLPVAPSAPARPTFAERRQRRVENAKKYLIGSLIGLGMVLGVYASAQGGQPAMDQQPEPVVASVNVELH